LRTIFLGWLRTMILLISASWVARVYRHPRGLPLIQYQLQKGWMLGRRKKNWGRTSVNTGNLPLLIHLHSRGQKEIRVEDSWCCELKNSDDGSD
jgi:hypothetical protein